jgi:hypothetical protein
MGTSIHPAQLPCWLACLVCVAILAILKTLALLLLDIYECNQLFYQGTELYISPAVDGRIRTYGHRVITLELYHWATGHSCFVEVDFKILKCIIVSDPQMKHPFTFNQFIAMILSLQITRVFM